MAKFHAIGRRKTSVARVYMDEGAGSITVNGKDYKDYKEEATSYLTAALVIAIVAVLHKLAIRFMGAYWNLLARTNSV